MSLDTSNSSCLVNKKSLKMKKGLIRSRNSKNNQYKALNYDKIRFFLEIWFKVRLINKYNKSIILVIDFSFEIISILDVKVSTIFNDSIPHRINNRYQPRCDSNDNICLNLQNLIYSIVFGIYLCLLYISLNLSW